MRQSWYELIYDPYSSLSRVTTLVVPTQATQRVTTEQKWTPPPLAQQKQDSPITPQRVRDLDELGV